jgi:hypothetical protein
MNGPVARRPAIWIACLCVSAGMASVLAPSADARSSYCSPTGDYCSRVYRSGGDILLEITAAENYGFNQVCVTRRSKVCRSIQLRRNSRGAWVSRAAWNRRFPNQGKGIYRVRWQYDGQAFGVTLTFRR